MSQFSNRTRQARCSVNQPIESISGSGGTISSSSEIRNNLSQVCTAPGRNNHAARAGSGSQNRRDRKSDHSIVRD